jgi:hypothetical protein
MLVSCCKAYRCQTASDKQIKQALSKEAEWRSGEVGLEDFQFCVKMRTTDLEMNGLAA